MYKSHTCGELRLANNGDQVTMAGWVHRRRSFGGLTFLDLRDRFGIVQIVADPELSPEAHQALEPVRMEWVLQIQGVVRQRPEGTQNPNLPTGDIEVVAKQVRVLNASKTPPFLISKDEEADENTRLRYRYLDLRRERMRRNLEMRHRTIKFIRDYLDQRGFIEVETPILFKTTARRRSRLPGAIASPPRRVLRPASIAAAVETIIDGRRCGALFPNRPLLPG